MCSLDSHMTFHFEMISCQGIPICHLFIVLNFHQDLIDSMRAIKDQNDPVGAANRRKVMEETYDMNAFLNYYVRYLYSH